MEFGHCTDREVGEGVTGHCPHCTDWGGVVGRWRGGGDPERGVPQQGSDKGDNWPACRGRQPDNSSARATREVRQTKDVLTSARGVAVDGWRGGGG